MSTGQSAVMFCGWRVKAFNGMGGVRDSDGENTLNNNVFKILWSKYMLYFLYFNNKIQNTIQAVMHYHY